MNRTIQVSPLSTYNVDQKMEENTLRKTLIARINNFLPAHKHDYCEKRFQNSSIKEMQNAVGRNRHVQMARSQQSRLLKDFKESQNGTYEEVLDKSKLINPPYFPIILMMDETNDMFVLVGRS